MESVQVEDLASPVYVSSQNVIPARPHLNLETRRPSGAVLPSMPFKPKRPCQFAGCPRLTHGRYCQDHQRQVGGAYDQARGSAAKRGYGRTWRKLRLLVLHRDPICSVDDCDQPSEDVDHIIPRDQGGDDRMSNLQGLCHAHHSAKTDTEMARDQGRWSGRAKPRRG